MHGLMMETPLVIPNLVTARVERLFADRPVVTRTGSVSHRSTWGETVARARRLAGALRELGIGPGDRVGTFAWGTQRHVEVYLAVPSMGAVLHTVNFRLAAEQVAYIVDHADDSVVLCQRSLLPTWREVAALLERPRRLVVLPDPGETGGGAGAHDGIELEDLLARARPLDRWSDVGEGDAAHMSYTTGTTGRPKGVVFSHRSTVLQSFCSGLAEAEGLTPADTLCPMVPLALSQVGLPWAAALHGCGLVLPGHDYSPSGLCEVVAAERPTIAVAFGGALPGMLEHWRREHPDLSSLRALAVGGFAVPRQVSRAFEEEIGVPILQIFGMTETSGHGCFTHLPAEALAEPSEESRSYYLTTQGRPLPLVESRLTDDDGAEVPWDGASMGEFQVRGPWIVREYYRMDPSPEHHQDGWLRTGDAATIDPMGYVRILDRTRDLVRSSEGWISSLQLEEHLLAHPAVAEAAVVAVPDGERGERPLACVVLRGDAADTVAGEDLVEFLRPRVPASWLPEAVVFTDALPRTSVGKTDKRTLRARHAGAGR